MHPLTAYILGFATLPALALLGALGAFGALLWRIRTGAGR